MERNSNYSASTDIPSGRAPRPLGGSSFEIPPGFRDNRGSNDVSLFSSSLPVIHHGKLSFADAKHDSHSPKNDLPNLNQLGKDVKGKVAFDDLDVQPIGSLLPDDEDLLAGIADDFDLSGLPNQVEDLDEEDVFGSGGGLEMDVDPSEYLSVSVARTNINDSYVGNGPNGTTQYPHSVGTIVGEHPYGEHPSRTLFVRNINSNVEDQELRSLFEQYGDIRTLYTACKHRGFVMISYYDIRDARTAMRALQNKPLRRRKLDIHFSIPKENPSDKDLNQGTLVVFNLDPSVSNDDLRQIFGAYGEVKEIRETPHKRHHKFVEFYDVRAAEAALRALNRSDIAGKKIKLEPSRPGGARRNLMQQLNQDLEQDDSRSFRHSVGSPTGCSPPGIWAQFSNPADSSSLQSLCQSHSVGVNSFANKSSPGLASILPSISNSVRIPPIGKDQGRVNYLDKTFGYNSSPHGITSQQSHSFPEKGSAVLPNLGTSPGAKSSFGQSTTGSSGIGTLSGPQFLWGSPTSDQSHSSAWNASPSLGHSFTSNGQRQSLPQSTHDISFISSQPYLGHHVGSAPSGIPFERRFGYFPDSSDVPFMNPVTYGIGFGQNDGSFLMNMHARGAMNSGTSVHGQMSDPSSPGFRMIPSQRMSHMILGSGAYPIPAFSMEGDRARSRRPDNAANQFDSKKQYLLDLDKIKSGEDSRTTLMIKNIPNKYTAKMLLAAIDEKHKGTYDFFYLPIDFKNKCNVGYAFINMVSASHIIPFYQAFNGKKWDKFNSEKVASLAYARIQGKNALVSHFQNSSLMNEDKRCRPILFHYEGPESIDLDPFPSTLSNINFEIRQHDGSSVEASASSTNNPNGSNNSNGIQEASGQTLNNSSGEVTAACSTSSVCLEAN